MKIWILSYCENGRYTNLCQITFDPRFEWCKGKKKRIKRKIWKIKPGTSEKKNDDYKNCVLDIIYSII